MASHCSKPSEIWVNRDPLAAVMKCFSCGFTEELGPGADLPVIYEIEEREHHKGRWKKRAQ